MHLVTSAIFLPSFLSHLSYPSGVLLLRTYFLISLALYIARGRPALPIAEFYNSVTSTPQPPGPHPKPAEKTYKEDRSAGYDTEGSQKVWLDVSDQITPNPWLPIVQTTLVHPNEHLCKLQRSLLHFANIFGETAPGEFGSVRELEGAEFLDGTLFIRAAGLTANRLGWMREGQAERRWDMDGFF